MSKSAIASSRFVIAGAALLGLSLTACHTVDSGADLKRDQRAEAEILRIYEQERDNLLRMDIEGQDRLLPDDFVVTNPFNMFIPKPEVMKRLQANIIQHSRYDREFDDFRRYGETMIVIGKEIVVPTPDANRPDAGKVVTRRFTEIWIHRQGTWEKVARHASNVGNPE